MTPEQQSKPSLREVLNLIETAFMARLQEKTNWGRNMVEQAYKDAVREVIVGIFDDQNKRP